MKLAIVVGAVIVILIAGDLILNQGKGVHAIQSGFYKTMVGPIGG